MLEFEVNGQAYRADKIDVRTQFHIVRRLVPAVSGLVGAIANETPAEGEAAVGPPKFDITAAIGPFSQAIASMPQADADFVLDACLGVISRKVEGDRGWAKAFSSGDPMFDDIGLAEMMQLAYRAAEANLGGFFDALAALFPAGAKGLASLSSQTGKTG